MIKPGLVVPVLIESWRGDFHLVQSCVYKLDAVDVAVSTPEAVGRTNEIRTAGGLRW